jgi:hypothetical protein
MHPWGDKPAPVNNWVFDQPVDADTHDHLATNPLILGVESALMEWTSTRSMTGRRKDGAGIRYLVRGPVGLIGSPLATAEGPWVSVNEHVKHAGLGVRCARSPSPRLKEGDFVRLLPLAANDRD